MLRGRRVRQNAGWGRGLALSLLALMIQILVPAGYMMADGPSGPSLVICTGHGPLRSAQDPGHPGKAPSSQPDAPCAFAGHAAAPIPPAGVILTAAPIRADRAPIQRLWDLTPGRGLAAPPPPAVGPPLSI